ncbi:tetratricopeptide repeat-containing protein [Roseovarius sp. SCSIO 43702]|nr:tetratricopeptide repeat-containing protein [Roseovarius sp. SCSIO 43702]
MFAPRIWGFDRADAEWHVARGAGWTRADLAWERLMETGCAGTGKAARRRFLAADLLARLRFAPGDPRRATAAAARWRLTGAEAHRLRALREWQGVESYIETLEIRPRARSSLFHLRMEARHRDTYHANLRKRLTAFATEMRETLEGEGHHRHAARWRGEKPTVFDDTRKLLAACLLIPDGERLRTACRD